MGDWTMEGLAFGTMLISMASVFVLSAFICVVGHWKELEGIVRMYISF